MTPTTARRRPLAFGANRTTLGEMLGETKKPRARRGLTDRMIKQAGIGVLIDGHGLRLKVTANPRTGDLRKSWIVRATVKDGPVREIGLGSAFDVPLKQARERAGEVRRLARGGVDPIAARKAAVAQRAAEAARAMTFRQCAEACIEAKRSGWRNAKHAARGPRHSNATPIPFLATCRSLKSIWQWC